MEELIARIIFFAVLIALIPAALRLIGRLIGYLTALLVEAIAVALHAGAMGLMALVRMSIPYALMALRSAWAQSVRVFIFMRILIDEIRGSTACEDEYEDSEEDDDRNEEFVVDPYVRAVWLLGLADGFSEAEFKTAYKKAIFAAHPDRTGSVSKAQEVNAARDLIRLRHGWA